MVKLLIMSITIGNKMIKYINEYLKNEISRVVILDGLSNNLYFDIFLKGYSVNFLILQNRYKNHIDYYNSYKKYYINGVIDNLLDLRLETSNIKNSIKKRKELKIIDLEIVNILTKKDYYNDKNKLYNYYNYYYSNNYNDIFDIHFSLLIWVVDRYYYTIDDFHSLLYYYHRLENDILIYDIDDVWFYDYLENHNNNNYEIIYNDRYSDNSVIIRKKIINI